MESKNSLRNKPGVFSNFIPGKDGSVSPVWGDWRQRKG